MQKGINLKKLLFLLIIISLSLYTQRVFSQTIEKKETTEIELEARIIRQQGLKAQQAGQLDEAIILYKKAITLDPLYVEPHNDLGVVYEMKGDSNTAEEFYLKALELNPYYLPAYSNLALLYENKGELKKAAEYWQKRIKLGSYDDPWTIKAIQHLKNIALVIEEISQKLKEQEIIELIEDVKASSKKSGLQPLNEKQKKVKEYLNRAEFNLKQKNYTQALNDAAIAKHLDPKNTQIDEFINKVNNELKKTYRR
jgi:tetratricopeptide (TPR) repeat protein